VDYGRRTGLRAVTVQVPVANPGWTVYLSAGFLITGFTTNHYPSQTSGPESALLLTYDLASQA
jgi:hypothetical protein